MSHLTQQCLRYATCINDKFTFLILPIPRIIFSRFLKIHIIFEYCLSVLPSCSFRPQDNASFPLPSTSDPLKRDFPHCTLFKVPNSFFFFFLLSAALLMQLEYDYISWTPSPSLCPNQGMQFGLANTHEIDILLSRQYTRARTCTPRTVASVTSTQ